MVATPSLLLPLLLLLARLYYAYCNDYFYYDDDLMFKLNNGMHIPLVGMGIGNLQHELITQVVSANLVPSKDIRLIDTAHSSNNEQILGQVVADFDKASRAQTRGGGSDKPPPALHVITKVWYTHLGYERTKISVQESLHELASLTTRQVYVHMLLHWPRCNDKIEWMNCEEEENNLPQFVKDAGPPPHLDKENAFKDSWRALEELYNEHDAERQRSDGAIGKPIIASIGVSNFELDDMKALIELAHVRPQIYQGNSWLTFHDPHLMIFLREHDIFFQAYAVMFGIIQQRQDSPSAFHILSTLSHELSETIQSSSPDKGTTNQPVVTEATILLAYMVLSNIGVIPRAASKDHQHENSPSSVKAVARHLTPDHIKKLERAIPALMKGEELHASVSFMNAFEGAILLHWMHPDTNEEIAVSDLIHPGSVEVQQTHPGHIFVAYDMEGRVRKEFVVEAGYGEEQFFQVEL
jgi:diketogulonate reductase-like aldo/keto reductase